jgi:hypothetical protein
VLPSNGAEVAVDFWSIWSDRLAAHEESIGHAIAAFTTVWALSRQND